MTTTETPAEKHTRLAQELLDDASREIAAGDLMQGSEKLWGATTQALRAYCASREMPHGKYAQHRSAANQLARERNDPSIRTVYGLAQSCHANFYNDWMEQEDLYDYLPDIQRLVDKILTAKAN